MSCARRAEFSAVEAVPACLRGGALDRASARAPDHEKTCCLSYLSVLILKCWGTFSKNRFVRSSSFSCFRGYLGVPRRRLTRAKGHPRLAEGRSTPTEAWSTRTEDRLTRTGGRLPRTNDW